MNEFMRLLFHFGLGEDGACKLLPLCHIGLALSAMASRLPFHTTSATMPWPSSPRVECGIPCTCISRPAARARAGSGGCDAGAGGVPRVRDQGPDGHFVVAGECSDAELVWSGCVLLERGECRKHGWSGRRLRVTKLTTHQCDDICYHLTIQQSLSGMGVSAPWLVVVVAGCLSGTNAA